MLQTRKNYQSLQLAHLGGQHVAHGALGARRHRGVGRGYRCAGAVPPACPNNPYLTNPIAISIIQYMNEYIM